MKRSKAYRDADAKIDQDNVYSPADAVELAKSATVTKFDPTVEVNLRLGVDPRKQDQMVRGTVNLPNGTGKTARVLVFATGDRAAEATAAGADFVGSDDLIERIQGGFLDFDAVVATPDLMGKVGRLGRAARSSSGPTATGTSTSSSARHPSPRSRCWRTTRQRLTRSSGSSRPPLRVATSGRSPSPPRWPPASRWTRTRPAPSSTSLRPRTPSAAP